MDYTILTPIRNQYTVKISEPKSNNSPLDKADYLNIGYMAGRFGVNLLNPNEANPLFIDNNGAHVNINSCCAPLFEESLKNSGIRFERIV